PRHLPKREAQIGLGEKLGCEPVGTTDEHNEVRPALVAPAADALGEYFARESFAAFVERDHDGLRRNHSGELPAFFNYSIAGAGGAAFVDLFDRDRADADGASGFRGAFAVALGQVALRPALKATDRGDE